MSFGKLGLLPLDHTLAFKILYRTFCITFHGHLLTVPHTVGSVSSLSVTGSSSMISPSTTIFSFLPFLCPHSVSPLFLDTLLFTGQHSFFCVMLLLSLCLCALLSLVELLHCLCLFFELKIDSGSKPF